MTVTLDHLQRLAYRIDDVNNSTGHAEPDSVVPTLPINLQSGSGDPGVCCDHSGKIGCSQAWTSRYTLIMNISTLVTPMVRQTLSADVYSQLRELLISGRMMPGEKLSLRTIAEALGVSVMPVREAVHRLVAEQALEMSANRYIRVPVLTVSQFREITSIRLNLEGQAAGQAASLASPQALVQIEAIHEEFCSEFAQSVPDESRLIALNKQLHFAIYDQADMPILLRIIESLWLRIGPILNYDLRSGNERVVQRVQASHHSALVEALKKRNPGAASHSLQNDIRTAADFILETGVLVVADTVRPASTD